MFSLKKINKNGFTLIELIAVLVILAIIALIVTPLVMNIVKKAKDSANKRSVDAYGKAVELAIATHLLDTGDYPTSLDNLKVEYEEFGQNSLRIISHPTWFPKNNAEGVIRSIFEQIIKEEKNYPFQLKFTCI